MVNKKLTAKEIIKRFEHLDSSRVNWEDHWQELAEFHMPRKATVTVRRTAGDKRNTLLLDNTGMQSAEKLAGALHGLLTNPNVQFFELTTGDPNLDQSDKVREWLQDATRKMHNVLNNSNFQTEVHEMYLDLVIFGTAAMDILDDPDKVVRFSTKPISQLYVSENHLQVIEEVYRCFRFNARQILQEFGEEALNEDVKRLLNQDPEKKLDIIHAVYRDDLEKDSVSPYVSQYVLKKGEHMLREARFRQFPYVVPRWSKTSDEIYGRSPAMTSLPEMKTLNKMTETTIKGAQKVVDPPLQAPDDGFILPIKTRPGGMNYYRAGSVDRIEPIFNDARIDFGFQAMEDKRIRIRDAFFVNALQLREGPQMTATEVLQRTEESMRLLGPVLGRQQSEFLRPLIDRVYDLMDARDMFEELPEELEEVDVLDVQYSSLIAKSQRVGEMQNILRAIEVMSPFLQLEPDSRDVIDSDRALRKIASGFMLPHELIRSQREIEDIREARAEAQEEAIRAQQEAAQAENLQKTAPAMRALQEG